MNDTFRCEQCSEPMENGRVSHVDGGYIQTYRCSNCKNIGGTRVRGREVEVKGMFLPEKQL